MKKVTLRIPPDGDSHGMYLTFTVYVDRMDELSDKIKSTLNGFKDDEGAIRFDLSYGIISGRVFIADKWDIETFVVSVEEEEDMGVF
jgi:hypothetical protein